MLELSTLIARNARYRPDAIAVVADDQRLSYRDFWARVARAANLLRSAGIGPGDKVATVAANSLELLEIYWAVPTIGAVLVPLGTVPYVELVGLSRHLLRLLREEAKVL